MYISTQSDFYRCLEKYSECIDKIYSDYAGFVSNGESVPMPIKFRIKVTVKDIGNMMGFIRDYPVFDDKISMANAYYRRINGETHRHIDELSAALTEWEKELKHSKRKMRALVSQKGRPI